MDPLRNRRMFKLFRQIDIFILLIFLSKATSAPMNPAILTQVPEL
jgi:hypothetical protein